MHPQAQAINPSAGEAGLVLSFTRGTTVTVVRGRQVHLPGESGFGSGTVGANGWGILSIGMGITVGRVI